MRTINQQELQKINGGAQCSMNSAQTNLMQVSCTLAFVSLGFGPIGWALGGPTAAGCLFLMGYCDNF